MKFSLLLLFHFSMIFHECIAFQFNQRLPLWGWKETSRLSIRHGVPRQRHPKSPRLATRRFSLTAQDEEYLQKAVDYAKLGLGATFPNPAVGCVLVHQESGKILGKGFHPRAGYPHAEVFALFEAAGLVSDGVIAAKEIVDKPQGQEEIGVIETLLEKYASDDGVDQLFGNLFKETPVTAYVTLEPCSHYGRTPPCAYSLATSKVNRVVVGFRDPNPRVDGGGVKLLQDAGITVEMALEEAPTKAKACEELVSNFVKRITPSAGHDDYSYVTGAMRRSVRSLAGRRKAEGTMVEISWQGSSVEANERMEQSLAELVLPARWMEELDSVLWKEEIVVLKLNSAVAKKKGAKILGQRIADSLRAHVAQTVGHTCLLYRPGMPPIMDLEQI